MQWWCLQILNSWAWRHWHNVTALQCMQHCCTHAALLLAPHAIDHRWHVFSDRHNNQSFNNTSFIFEFSLLMDRSIFKYHCAYIIIAVVAAVQLQMHDFIICLLFSLDRGNFVLNKWLHCTILISVQNLDYNVFPDYLSDCWTYKQWTLRNVWTVAPYNK